MEIAKKKALDLVGSFYDLEYTDVVTYTIEWGFAKQCAVVCVEEIKKSYGREFDFWDKVIKEIEKL